MRGSRHRRGVAITATGGQPALGRAWRSHRQARRYGSIKALARAERVSHAYVYKLLRLTLLAPEIVERILDGRGRVVGPAALLKPFPVGWERQRERFC